MELKCCGIQETAYCFSRAVWQTANTEPWQDQRCLSYCSNGLSLQHNRRDLGSTRSQAWGIECPRAQQLCTFS